MNRLLLILFLFINIVGHSQECRVCGYLYESSFSTFFNSRTTNTIDINLECPESLSLTTWWGANRTFYLEYTNDDGCIVTPVELVDFDCIVDGTNININWSTTSEKNNDYFVLQKSTDGIEWYDLQNIVGQGSSNTLVNYNSTDLEPNTGDNYYRLIQNDYNGEYEIHKTTYCRLNNNISEIIYINLLGRVISEPKKGPYFKIIKYDNGGITKELLGKY